MTARQQDGTEPMFPAGETHVQPVHISITPEGEESAVGCKPVERFPKMRRPRYLVEVGNEDSIARLRAFKSTDDAVSLPCLGDPGIRVAFIGQVVNDDVNDPVEEGSKSALVFGKIKRLWQTSVSAGGFDQHKTVHQLIKLYQPNFKQIEFIEERKAIEESRPAARCHAWVYQSAAVLLDDRRYGS